MVNPVPIIDEFSCLKAMTCSPNLVSILPDGSLLRKAIQTSPNSRLLLRENLKKDIPYLYFISSVEVLFSHNVS